MDKVKQYFPIDIKDNWYVIYSVAYLCFCLSFCNNQFFWDTIQLGSKHAHHYFEHGLSWSFLPDEFNSGHIPAFGYYLAFCWTILGKSLFVSHLAMLPFVAIFLVFIKKVFSILEVDTTLLPLTLIIVTLDPTWIAQITLISPDIILVSMLIVLLYGILSDCRWCIVFGSIGLCLVSIRGMYCCLLLATFYFYRTNELLKSIKWFVPAFTMTSGYYILHYLDASWIGVHSDSPWKESISLTGLKQIAGNVVIYIWRLLDFGRVCWILPLLYIISKEGRASLSIPSVKVFIVFLIGFGLLTIPFSSLTAHRYYLPVIILGLIAIVLMIRESNIVSRTRKGLLLAVIVISQIGGHAIKYPQFVAQGWDSSLRYLPALSIFEEVDRFVNEEGMACKGVGTLFPLKGQRRFRDLSDSNCNYAELNLSKNQFVVYSNVMNDFQKSDYEELRQNWINLQSWNRGGIECVLFQKKKELK